MYISIKDWKAGITKLSNSDDNAVTGSTTLLHTGLDIDIHKRARIKYINGDLLRKKTSENNSLYGLCLVSYNEDNDVFNFRISSNESIGRDGKSFIFGHEEGHAIIHLGMLQRLYNNAKDLGIYINFLNKSTVIAYDKEAISILDNESSIKRIENFMNPDLEERICDLSGLISLIRVGANNQNKNFVYKNVLYNNTKYKYLPY